jgi:hypothetical protein
MLALDASKAAARTGARARRRPTRADAGERPCLAIHLSSECGGGGVAEAASGTLNWSVWQAPAARQFSGFAGTADSVPTSTLGRLAPPAPITGLCAWGRTLAWPQRRLHYCGAVGSTLARRGSLSGKPGTGIEPAGLLSSNQPTGRPFARAAAPL